MTVRNICEMAAGSLNTLADMMIEKAGKIARTDSETARQLIINATALQKQANEITKIGGGQR